jgi:hypothetical protein
MPGFNTLPAVGGGGGQANMTYVASVHMETYNRTWAQGGTPGYYAMYSTNQENGYVYFVGSTTTGGPLNRLINVTHSFTSINIIAPNNDMVSLYKAKVKSTSVFNNPFAGFSSFPSQITSSGNFVLPNNALPLVNILLAGGGGGGGHGDHSHGGGGGAGGSVIKLTAFQAVGTTSVTIGSGSNGQNYDSKGGDTYFGNVHARGGGSGGHGGGHPGSGIQNGHNVGNGGGAGGGSGQSGGVGFVQTVSTGLGTAGSPEFHGGHNGGGNDGGSHHHHRGGGGGGAGGAGSQGHSNSGGNGGPGVASDILGSTHHYGTGGWGSQYNNHGSNTSAQNYAHGGNGGREGNGNRQGGGSGLVTVRYYIP